MSHNSIKRKYSHHVFGPQANVYLQYEYNIRDIVVHNRYTPKASVFDYNYVIVSCANNGVLFFTLGNLDDFDSDDYITLTSVF